MIYDTLLSAYDSNVCLHTHYSIDAIQGNIMIRKSHNWSDRNKPPRWCWGGLCYTVDFKNEF